MSQPNLESASQSLPASTGTVLNKKPMWNIYTVLLLLGLLALLLGCLFLYLEIREFGGFGQVRGPVAMVTGPLQNLAQSWFA